MEEVYDLSQFPYFVVIHIQKTKVGLNYYFTAEKQLTYPDGLTIRDTCITYDKQKINIKSLGKARFLNIFRHDEDEDDGDEEDENEEEDDDDVCINNFKDKLYRVFKKDKEEWNEDDLFSLKAVSDFIRLSVEDLIEESEKLKSTDQLHYIFVVPSEWEEEIRETLLRPILIQSNLILKDDHNDRLLFCSDLESTFYCLMKEEKFDFEKIRKTIFCRFSFVSESEILIKLNLVSTVNYLFDLSDSLLYPNVDRFNSLSLTINTFNDGIRVLIKDKLPFSIQEEIIQIIMDKEYKDYKEYKRPKDYKNYKDYKEYEEDKEYLKKPLITDTSRWELDKDQLDFIESICIFDICSQICKNATNNIDDLLSNDIIKEYNFFPCIDSFSSRINPNKNLLNWSQYLMTHNQTYSRNRNIKCLSKLHSSNFTGFAITFGAFRYGLDALNNANIYCRPRILPVRNSANSSSIFQESKPDAVMNIDISIESTLLSFSLLDENGFVKEVWNHNHFLKDKSLCSLGSFFNFSEITTLNVKSSFIEFAEYYLIEYVGLFSGEQNNVSHQLNTTKIETMLCKDSYTEDLLVSTQQQIYIKSFLLLYMAYIKYVISNKLSDIVDSNTEVKIGYNVTTEKIVLNRLFDTKEGLKDIIYASGLIQKDDNSKKLRIIKQGERIMYLLQRSFTLTFLLNSYFVLAQLHENYIQLTLNKVVTEYSSNDEDQESVIIHDRIIHIPNIYTSLCLNMWNNIVEDSSLIKLCDRHQEYSGNDLLQIFSLKNQAKFTENLKQYISKDNLSNNSSQPTTDKIIISLSESCNCRVYLTVRDIIDVSFQPVLQDIVSLVSASFINKELFGNFWNIQYLFQLIQFSYNSQLHDSLIKMLKETTENIIIEQKVDIPYYVIPKSLNQLLQPVLHQRPISYKEFQVGTLCQVRGDSYGFSFSQLITELPLIYKGETKNIKVASVNEETLFPFFNKGELINDLPKTQTFYLSREEEAGRIYFGIKYFKLKMTYDLNFDGTVRLDDLQEVIAGCMLNNFPKELKKGQDVPILITVFYEAYSGSLILRTKLIGQDININESLSVGTPMHLSRF